MTIKEAARDLGISENYIYSLIKDGLIDYFVIGTLDYPVSVVIENDGVYTTGRIKHQNSYKRQIGIDQQEMDYIDWFLSLDKDEKRNIRKMAKENCDLQKQNRRKMTIEIYY